MNIRDLVNRNNKKIQKIKGYTEEDIKKESHQLVNTKNPKISTKIKQSIPKKPEWQEFDYEEGQLAIDVYQKDENIIIKSTLAGTKPEDINISLDNDTLTIRGKRELNEKIPESDYLYKECYWGPFSRSVILPSEVKNDKVKANIENGILTIILPKKKSKPKKIIKVSEK